MKRHKAEPNKSTEGHAMSMLNYLSKSTKKLDNKIVDSQEETQREDEDEEMEERDDDQFG
jgi:hypothetical protein